MMRRHGTVAAFLIVMLTSAVHAFAQSNAGSPRIAPAPLTGVRQLPPRVLGFGDNGESGTYTYDGSGNIIAIGSDTFLYDAEGRLVSAFVRGAQATYTYDPFGNRKTATGETNCLGQSVCATPLTVDTGTNRLLTTTANGATTNVGYGPDGNITAASGGLYTYDGTGMMTEATVGSDDRQFVYTADDERIAVRQGVSWTWTVRGPDNKVLREFTSVEPNNSPGLPINNRQWVKDYVWRDGLLLASIDATGTYHYHLDHLGTPRLITNMTRVKIAEHAYYPFGAEISLTPHESIEEAMKFTGHERDIVAGDGHTLDDMHARYYNASMGRFLSVDPALGVDYAMRKPQAWNRYAYAQNNPTDNTDPDGRADAKQIFTGLVALDLAPAFMGYYTYFQAELAMDAIAPPPPAKNGEIQPTYFEFLLVSALVPAAPAARIAPAESAPTEAAATPKVSTLNPGPHAGDSIPARTPQPKFTPQERGAINDIGGSTGCHTCGSTNPGTKSGNFVPDHQPSSATIRPGQPQRLYPHCLACSRIQGGEVRQLLRTIMSVALPLLWLF